MFHSATAAAVMGRQWSQFLCFFSDGYGETGGNLELTALQWPLDILIVEVSLLMARGAWETSEDEM